MRGLVAALAAVALATSTAGYTQAALWSGAGDGVSYEDPLNWDVVEAFPGSTRDIASPATVVRAADVTVNRTFVSGGAVLNVTGGTQSDGQSGNTIRNFVGNGSVGTVNMSGGAYGIGHVLAIAHSNNSDGVFSVTGGDLSVFRGGNSLVGGYGGIFAQGHSISIGGNSTGSNVTGLFEISGGSLVTRTGVAVANNGVFSVVGSATNQIRLGGSNDDAGWFAVSSNGTLKAAVDSSITPIFVEAQTNTSPINPGVEFQLGALLDLSFVGAPTPGTWTLLELEGQDIVDGGLALSGTTASGWSFAVDNNGDNGLLTATYTAVPEPASLALMVLGGLFALQLRRKA
ncbi:hypothetical protein Pla175_22570 [Pirellulimonas nuda]|uniref:Ice-binding protein C-terminal domain-containing protein n=2 Tax=Pirellulimonas nuda TaxID=2528009 RepID=A0A518DBN7_9BACT|nr:hypothetical protein Pla175_22570 [Pirellulimonas nuda]